jgi:hypothetical protein
MQTRLFLVIVAGLLLGAVEREPDIGVVQWPETWVTGWDQPVDPDGDCRLDRNGERLTVTIPGTCHTLYHDEQNAPRLLRDLAGDFAIQVRVSGACRTRKVKKLHGWNRTLRAGLVVLAGGETVVRLWWEMGLMESHRADTDSASWEWIVPDMPGAYQVEASSSRQGPVYLRLERWGCRFFAAFSEDGLQWNQWRSRSLKLPRNLKVGIAAENMSATEFQAEFDQFKLSRPDR